MDKQQIQKEIAKTEAALAELRESLDKPENVVAKFGEVWEAAGNTYITLENESFCPEMPDDEGFDGCEGFSTGEGDTRLGTFQEVFIRRSEVEENYVSKEALGAELRRSSAEGYKGASWVRMNIADEFGLHHTL
jgi:hypothetical protein